MARLRLDMPGVDIERIGRIDISNNHENARLNQCTFQIQAEFNSINQGRDAIMIPSP